MTIAEESRLPVVAAQEIRERIERGDPVIYDHVTIDGDIDLSLLDLPLVHCQRPAGQEQTARVVACRIQIRNCELLGKVDFAGALLREAVDLTGSILREEARFKGACFLGEAFFEATSFKRYATFRNASFHGDARFQGASFHAIANFGNAIFQGDALFSSASFSELCTNFGEAHFLANGDFTEARFAGTANFRLAAFQTISFWKTEFAAEANFQGSVFGSYASFQSSTFFGNADFRGARFRDELNLEFAQFKGDAIFLSSHLSGKCNFFRAQFERANFEDVVMEADAGFLQASFGAASFRSAQFQKGACFEQSTFREGCDFSAAELWGMAGFDSARFAGHACFEHAVFAGPAHFPSTIFAGESSFSKARFEDEAAFDSAQFGSQAHFDGVRFQGDGSFQATQLMEAADFTAAAFCKDLLLQGARIQVMRLSGATFEGSVNLNNADFSRLEVRWSSLRDHLAYDGAAYLSLAKNFRNLEWFEDADDCYYQYRRQSQAAKRFLEQKKGGIEINWSKLLDALALVSCGYGVRPRHTVFLSVLVILLFGMLFWTGDSIVVEHINSSATGSHLAADDRIHSLSFADHLYFSAMIFTAKTVVKWYPVGVYRYLATAESILGWLLLALFLVTLGRTMIR